MQKSSYVILAIFSLTTFFVLSGCDSEWNRKSPPYPCYSQTIEESKENGVFQYEVIADKSILTLDSALKIEVKKAWLENPSSRRALVFGKAPLKKLEGAYQLIINLKIDSVAGQSSAYFYFISNKPLDTFIHHFCDNYYSNRIDTILVPLYRETSPKLPSRKERKAFDTLTFVKRIIEGSKIL